MSEGQPGILYLCATPIGNLEDMTPRAIRMLKEADLIAAEDTRHTRQLLTHFELHGHLVSYHEHNKDRQGPVLLAELLAGKNIALVSDAGFPGIADPGEALAQLAIVAGVRVVPVPGANAALCALIASGLPAAPFFFCGFLPKSKKKRREELSHWQYIPATIVLYEAPHRIKEVLRDLLACWGERHLVIGRELTKLHEEFFRGTFTEALDWLESQPPRGEFCLVIARGEAPVTEAAAVEDPLVAVQRLVAEGLDKKLALVQVAKAYKVPKRELYNKLLLLDKEGETL
ncbi:MAG: 16S rRNA (cytidine(1402)-2'-O)-methyltransferase [Acidaminococcaceae bacterium]